jgi:hypothetical protein
VSDDKINSTTILELAKSPFTPPAFLTVIASTHKADSRYDPILSAIAENPSTPDQVLWWILDFKNNYKVCIARNPRILSDRIVRKLISTRNAETQRILALRADLSSPSYKKLYLTNDLQVFFNLASNPSTPPEILDEIINRSNRSKVTLSKKVILNPNTLPSTLLKLMPKYQNSIIQHVTLTKEFLDVIDFATITHDDEIYAVLNSNALMTDHLHKMLEVGGQKVKLAAFEKLNSLGIT